MDGGRGARARPRRRRRRRALHDRTGRDSGRDTLVVADKIDDIVSLDPAESFAFSGNDLLGRSLSDADDRDRRLSVTFAQGRARRARRPSSSPTRVLRPRRRVGLGQVDDPPGDQRLAPVSGGAIRIDGMPVPVRRGPGFVRRVQMVFQDPYGSLHPKRTVDATLAEPLAIHGLPGPTPGSSGRSPTSASTRASASATPTSSRAASASASPSPALMLEPEILLLDEPTSALDASVHAELLARLRNERGLTFLMVSHNLAVIGHMCDRLLVMRGGSAVEALDRADLAALRATDPYTLALFAAKAHEAA